MSGVPLTEPVLLATSPTSFAVGKLINLYTRGTEIEIAVYSDEALTIPVAQPLITDRGGRLRANQEGVAGTGTLFVAEGSVPDVVWDGQRVPLPPLGSLDRTIRYDPDSESWEPRPPGGGRWVYVSPVRGAPDPSDAQDLDEKVEPKE